MIQLSNTIGRTTRRITILTGSLLVAASGTATAHGSGSYGGGMMGSGVWGPFGGTMGLWRLLWMSVLLAIPFFLAYSLLTKGADESGERPLSVLRERYARGELSDDEFERQREQLIRAE